MLKRDNWTNEEILEILRSRVIQPEQQKDCHMPDSMMCGYNCSLDGLIDEFESCEYPPEVFGAFAYDTEQKTFVHIGQIPEECPKIKHRY